MLKNGKSVNRNEHQNRENEVFWHKNRKTDLKNSQNRKTKNPIAPPLYLNIVIPFFLKDRLNMRHVMANLRKIVALYTMTVTKLATNQTFNHTPRNSNLRAFDCSQCPGMANVTLA